MGVEISLKKYEINRLLPQWSWETLENGSVWSGFGKRGM